MKTNFSFLVAALIAIGGVIAFIYVVGKNGIKLDEFKPCEFVKSFCKKKEDEDVED